MRFILAVPVILAANLAFAAGETVSFEPGGLHVMLQGLGGDPIEAKRDSMAYILKKVIARHRAPATITAAFLVLVVVAAAAAVVLCLELA